MAEPGFDDEADITAAELALGVLDGPDHAAALRRILSDPVFARDVDGWRERLAPLADMVPEQAPPASLWPKIEAAIALRGDGDGNAGALRRSVSRWRMAAGFTSALAASLLGWIAIDAARPPREVIVERTVPGRPMMVAQLAPADAGPMAIAAMMPDGALKIAPGPMVADGGSAELWMIHGDAAPVSLGLVRPGEMNVLAIRAELRPMLNGDAVLAISIEPTGGSRTGKPTGPVVATGRMTAI